MHVQTIAIDQIRPGSRQARRCFDEQRLVELAQSIRESGVLQPLVVRSIAPHRYELLAGERRWRAAQRAGLHALPAVIRDDLSDEQAQILGLVENLQRESLSPMETAAGLRRLLDESGLTHETLGERIGKSRVYVTNYLRLLTLDAEVQAQIDRAELTLGHAKVLAGLAPAMQRRLAVQTRDERLSVHALERRAANAANASGAPADRRRSVDVQRLERSLADQIGYPVRAEVRADGAGCLRLGFNSLDELDGLLDRLGYRAD